MKRYSLYLPMLLLLLVLLTPFAAFSNGQDVFASFEKNTETGLISLKDAWIITR
jgi:hypothetical protein